MNRSIFGVVAVAGLLLSVQTASAEALYWKIDGQTKVYQNSERKESEAISVSTMFADADKPDKAVYARVVYGTVVGKDFVMSDQLPVLELDDITQTFTDTGTSFVKLYGKGGDAPGSVDPTWVGLSDGMDWSQYKFQIQIGEFNEQGVFLLHVITDAEDYATLYDAWYIADSEYYAQWTDPWTGSGYIVPEPTAGMLVLIGCMMLGLKRKREVA